jgi:hypothetical protein
MNHHIALTHDHLVWLVPAALSNGCDLAELFFA